MALRTSGQFQYGDSQADIRDELHRYSVLNAYETAHFADAVCVCGHTIFQLEMEWLPFAARACLAVRRAPEQRYGVIS
jgi:hypothetical protein